MTKKYADKTAARALQKAYVTRYVTDPPSYVACLNLVRKRWAEKQPGEHAEDFGARMIAHLDAPKVVARG
jgi:hypothetical protein